MKRCSIVSRSSVSACSAASRASAAGRVSSCAMSSLLSGEGARQTAGGAGAGSLAALMPEPATVPETRREGEPDVVVVGAGIVGLAVARELLRRDPGLDLRVVDAAGRIGAHQTGHNSGVVHAGVYYAPGSLKARL